MPYGRLNDNQRQAVRHLVRGRVVHDLGAGDLTLSYELLTLGAKRVVAIEKEGAYLEGQDDPRIEKVYGYFEDYKEPIKTAFLSWPVNYRTGLTSLVGRAERVIYLGKNTDGTMCGTPELMSTFLHRELLAYIPDQPNVLAAYGAVLKTKRLPRGEEMAGVRNRDGYWRYQDAEDEANEALRFLAPPDWRSSIARPR